MNRIRPLIICLTLILFFVLALLLRTIPPFDKVFTSAGIRFTTVDAYYQMYIVDNLAHNFPKLTSSLPYLNYPNSMETGPIHFFNWLLAAVIWIIGMGKPTQHLVDVVGVYYPAVLGALTVIPVYFIGKALAGRWAGIIAAALIAILPGEFLGRSILGSTDQHVAESLFSAVAMLFLILALKTARQRQLTFEHFKNMDWAVIIRPMVFSLLAGLFLGIYLLTWVNGALLFIFVISLYFVIQFFIDHLRSESTDYLSMVGLALFSVAAIMILPVMHNGLYLIAMIIAWLVPVVLNGISRFMTNRQLKPIYFPFTVVGIGGIGLAVLYLVTPSLFRSMIDAFAVFFHPTGASLTTLEMQPIFSPNGSFTLALVWGNFTTSFFLGLLGLLVLIVNPKSVKSWIAFFIILAVWVSLFVVGQHASDVISILISILTITGLLVCLIIRQKDSDKSLIVVWSLIMLAATIGQRRFGYYLAVNVAILTGYLSAWVLEQCGIMKLKTRNENTTILAITMGIIAILFLIPVFSKGFLNTFTWIGIIALIIFFVLLFLEQKNQIREEVKVRRVTRPKMQSRISINPAYVYPVLALVMVFLTVYFPNIQPALDTAKGATFAPPDAWMESLTWMKDNTPEPFANPEHYYQLEAAGTPYPASAYGVLSWWDYGYWITRIAHRIPNVNPSQDSVRQNEVATIFTSQNETTANEIVHKLGTAYVVIDDQTALGKFWAVATWAGKPPAEFSEVYIIPQGTQASQVQVFYPEYYRSLAIRLYNFDGKAVTTNQTGSNQTFVISYEERKTNDGQFFKLITSAQSFGNMPSYSTTLSSAQIATLAQWLKGNPPLSPTGLNATAINAGQINLNWQENSTDEAGFRIERAVDNTFATGLVTIATTAPNTVSYNDNTTTGNTTYYYRVYAFNSAGDSVASNTASATTQISSVLPPAAVRGLSATVISTTQVNLNWIDNADSKTGVRVERATNDTFSANLTSVNIAANRTSFSDTVSGNTTYYYRVYTFNTGGSSVASNIASATTPGEMLNASVLYANNCASCHGANRQGSSSASALTSSTLVGKTDAQVTASVTNGITSYQQAEAFRISKNSTRYRIVSPNPFVSPVPLDAVQDYKLVYSSSQTLTGAISSVKIFEFTGNTSQSAGK